MKLNKLVLTLTAAALLPTFAYASTDEIAASFERDLYREPVNTVAVIAGETDPLTDVFNAALYGTTDPILASFERDLYREPVNTTAVIGREADPLADMFYKALWGGVDKPVMHAAIADSHRQVR